jgi:hypothetical protein
MNRAELGIDGNCGFALLGPNIQEGECEFEPIKDFGPVWHTEQHRQARLAINRAHMRLKKRLAPKEFSYFLGPSYPS